MALEHALLVSLREKPAAGLELARRFDKSIGFFWSATHQQIYRVLHRMAADGWVIGEAGESRKDTTIYSVTPLGEKVLAEWIAESTPRESFRSDLAVKMRAASFGDRAALIADIERRIGEHSVRLAHYRSLMARDYPHPKKLTGRELDQYLVLRGGMRVEEFWIQWLTEYVEAHEQ